MSSQIFIPTHFDVGNRGCEGISKGTIKLLDGYDVFLFSQNCSLDEEIAGFSNNLFSVGNLSIIKTTCYKLLKCLAIGNKHIKRYYECRIRLPLFFKRIKKCKSGIVFITGGDMFCYDDNYVVFLNRYLDRSRFKSVLWGCSIGQENMSQDKLLSLKKFDLIITRETLSRDFLKSEIGKEKVYCCPDPAFLVDAEEYFVEYSLNNTIGINLSNFVSEDVGEDTIFGKNITNLIEFIINETNMDILFIPHVFWKGQDDRIICNRLYNQYKNIKRVHVLDSEKMNYCQIRYVIGKCRFFIGARTHAMISAYSMCVPALALGYSIKSRGIANDIGLPANLVVDYKKLHDETEIKNAFCYLLREENNIRNHLKKVIPEYRSRAFDARKKIDELVVEKSK